MVPVYMCPVYGTCVHESSVWYLCTCAQCMVPVYMCPVYGAGVHVPSVWYRPVCVSSVWYLCVCPVYVWYLCTYVCPVYSTHVYPVHWYCVYWQVLSSTTVMVSVVYTCTYTVVVVKCFEGEIPWIPHSTPPDCWQAIHLLLGFH